MQLNFPHQLRALKSWVFLYGTLLQGSTHVQNWAVGCGLETVWGILGTWPAHTQEYFLLTCSLARSHHHLIPHEQSVCSGPIQGMLFPASLPVWCMCKLSVVKSLMIVWTVSHTWGVMLIFSWLQSKYQTRGNLRAEGFILVHSLNVQSAMMGKAWQPELFELKQQERKIDCSDACGSIGREDQEQSWTHPLVAVYSGSLKAP